MRSFAIAPLALAAVLAVAPAFAAPAVAAPRSGPEIMAPPMTIWCREQLALSEYYLDQYRQTNYVEYWELYIDAVNRYNLNCNF